MPRLNIALVGQDYQSRTTPLSAQVTQNLYPEPVPNGISPSALLAWPGAKLKLASTQVNRGLHEWKGHVYAVNGTNLVKVDSSYTGTVIGLISGTARCVFAGSSAYLYIVSNGLVWRTDGSTVESVNDSDLESPDSVAFLNSTLIYDGQDGRFVTSDAGDGSAIDSLNYATAEALPDDLIRVYTFNQQVYMMGEKSIEPWYNSGVGNPPFDRVEGGIVQVGIAGVHAVTNTDRAMYFLGHDKTAYRLEGYAPVQVSTVAINNAFESYETSDCVCFSLKLQGQSFVIYQFPIANKTWCFSETFNTWFELSTEGARHLVNGYVYAFGKHLVSDYRNGNIYEWDLNTYTDNGQPITRLRATQPIYSDGIAEAGKDVFWERLELFINSGNGLVLGQGQNPQVMMQYSDDGGYTWSTELWESAGLLGNYQWRVTWYSLGSSISRIYRFKLTDPIEFHMFKLHADVEVGI